VVPGAIELRPNSQERAEEHWKAVGDLVRACSARDRRRL